jgi:hypothetical protein
MATTHPMASVTLTITAGTIDGDNKVSFTATSGGPLLPFPLTVTAG